MSRTGQAAQEAGVSLDQLNALVTSAQQSTARGGAVIGNALKTIFTRLQRTDTLDQLEAFNISVRDVQGNILPAVQILQNFAGAYKGLADAQRAQLSEQVAGVYQVNILKAIVNDLNKSQGTYAGALQRGAAATNEAEVATAKLNQTLDALLKQTATSTQQLANNIGKVTFEPLAKYGTEQLKSFIESLNEVLEGEGVGSTFANGLLKGIRNVIAGPGAIAAFFTLFKLIQNSFTYLSQALPQIAGITTETQNRKNIEQSILQIMQQQGPVSQALAGNMGNQAAQAQLLLQVARQQTAEYQMQTTLAKQLAVQLAGQGVRVKGSGGLQVTRADGYIPNATKMAEVVGAQAGGYTPGRVVSSPVGGVMNTAEDVKYIPGFAQPFINPPEKSRAGKIHRANALRQTGVDPYMYRGFIPNFFADAKKSKLKQSLERGRDFEKLVGEYIGEPPSWNGAVDFKVVPNIPDDTSLGFNKKYYDSGTFADAHSGLGHTNPQIAGKIIRHSKLTYKNLLQHSNEDFWFDDNELVFVPDFTEIIGKGQDDEFLNKTKISSLSSDSKSEFLKGLSREEMQKAMNQKILLHYYKDRVNLSGGFIPNFAPPTSAIRIPWFKKFGNPAFDTIQPALGISKASDTETFRQINFKSTAEGADEKGDNNIFAPLFEDFAFKAMQLVSQQDVKDDLIRGYVLQPKTNQKQSAFDAALKEAGVGIEYKGYPKKNLTGSITGELTRKYETLSKTNPAAAAKLKELIIAFNEVGHENQITSELGKKLFSPLAGVSYSQMVKNSPDLVKGLSAETNNLLNSYVKNPAFLAMAAASGFIPNFAGKEINTKFFRTKTGFGEPFSKEGGTGLSGTVYRQPGFKSYGYQLKEQLNNMVMSILGNNVFIPDTSYINPKLTDDVNAYAENSARVAALRLSSAGKTKSLGMERGMMSEAFGNSRYVFNPNSVYTGQVSGRMKRVNYDRLSDVLGVFWSSNPETKSAWEDLKSLSESGKYEDKEKIRPKTALLKKAYNDWLAKNQYIGTRVKLSDYRQGAEGVRGANYAALRSDLAGVSNLQNLGEMEKLKKYKEQGIFYGDYKNNKAMYDKMGRWTYNAASKKMILNSASGFIPNFAYKQAVMGLEESMSGNKAIFDTKPFPHIRNSSQPTFSSAIADHGGLSNALSDSMRGQKAAGLMSGGFIPNFVNFGSSYPYMPSGTSSTSSTWYPSGNPNVSQQVSTTFAPSTAATNALFNQDDIDKAISNFINSVQSADEQLGVFESAFGGRTKLINNGLKKLEGSLSKGGVSGAALSDAMEKARKDISGQQSKLAKSLEKSSTTLAFAGPMAAGLIEQSVFGNRRRMDMSETERKVQAGLSTGLTAASTGASLGAAFGPWGAAIGLAAGAAVGLAQSLGAASLSADELRQVADEYKSKTQENVSTAQMYIDTLKTLNTSTDPEIIKRASDSLADNFNNIKDVELQKIFKQTGTDVQKLGEALYEYEKGRKKTQKEAEEDVLAAEGVKAKNAKKLSELGYNKTKTIKGPALVSDYTYLEYSKENDEKILNDFKQTFEDLSILTEDKAKQFQEMVREEKGKASFDRERISKFLTDNNISQGLADRLAERFDILEEDTNEIGDYLIRYLSRLLKINAQKVKQDTANKTVSDQLSNDFIKFKKEISQTLSDSLIAATDALNKYRFDTSLINLISGKMKEINDSIYSSISGNLSEVAAISLKASQLTYNKQFEEAQLSRLIEQTRKSTSLKNIEARSSYLNQSRETIFNSGGVQRSPDTIASITSYLSTSVTRTRKEFETFAGSLGLSSDSASVLAKTLEENQRAFRDKVQEYNQELKLKQEEIDLSRINNKINYEVGIKQLDLEKEKLKITYAQRDATLKLRKDSEAFKIIADEKLELKRIDIGSEFRYLGLNKRATFEAQQADQQSIFKDEQQMAKKQAIFDARKSIIEIAAQDANTQAQNANTEAVLGLVDIIADQQLQPYLQDIEKTTAGTPEFNLALSNFSKKAEQVADIKSNNSLLRKSFNERKNVLSYKELKDFGVTDNMSIEQAIDKLKSERTGKDQSTINAIDNTIQDLSNASQQLGSKADIFAAKVAQTRKDFEQSAGFVNNMQIGFKNLNKEADEMVDQLGRNLPGMFADGLVDGIKAAIRESDNLGDALMGIAAKFLDEISTTLMRASVRNIISGIGGFDGVAQGLNGNQKGGYIRAQTGMYISGSGSGDKYPALLENGEYVLNRRAVMAMGGPSALDTLNFSMAPRFASGGSFSNEFTDLKSMEDNMTSYGMENSKLYNELRDAEVAAAEERRRKAFARKQQRAAMIGSVVAAVASIGLAQGMSNFSQNAQAKKAESLAIKAQGPVNLTKAEVSAYENFQKAGFINQYGQYAGPQAQTGFRSFTSKPFYSSSIYGPNPYAPPFASDRKQTGGLIGSRLSDTIPGYMEGGLYNTPIVKRYGVGMQAGGMSPISNSNSNVVNTTNATNSFNFNTNVSRDGTIEVGSNSTSYAQQDVALSKNLNSKVYAVVLDAIKNEQRFGGSLAGTRQG